MPLFYVLKNVILYKNKYLKEIMMRNTQYDKFISIITQNEIVGDLAVEATELLLKLNENDLQRKDFEHIDDFITLTRTSMSDEESIHLNKILEYVRKGRVK